MGRIEKTVFISYRHDIAFTALAIAKSLTHEGYDVFVDLTDLGSGGYEDAIKENIQTRAHFLVLLTPYALERCGEPGDWLRLEIETALDSKRNIVPLMLEGFSFATPTIANQLTGRLAVLKGYHALTVSPDSFDTDMDRLRTRYLDVGLDAVRHPPSPAAAEAALAAQKAAEAAPAVTKNMMKAQKWFERGFNSTDIDERLLFGSEAIRLHPGFAEAFNNRGLARLDSGDRDGALRDFNEAIRLKPDLAPAFYNRGVARHDKEGLELAIEDYTRAIMLNPNYVKALNNRGMALYEKKDWAGAGADYDEALRLDPDDANALNNRGLLRRVKGDVKGALEDLDKVILLKPEFAAGFYNRALARKADRNPEGALEDFAEAIRLNPEDPDAFGNRAPIWEAKDRPADAIADLEQYLKLGGGVKNGNTQKVEAMIRELWERLKGSTE